MQAVASLVKKWYNKIVNRDCVIVKRFLSRKTRLQSNPLANKTLTDNAGQSDGRSPVSYTGGCWFNSSPRY